MQDIPRLEMPLHTLIELVPKPDGKMAETRIKVPTLSWDITWTDICSVAEILFCLLH